MKKLNSSIRLENISKSFGSVHANKDISLKITGGRILALLGENGAGKSTLMSILAGRLQPDSGQILVDGKRRVFNSEKDAISAGIGMVYQHFKLVESMTVAENVFLGQEEGFFLNTAKMEHMVSELAKSYSLEIAPSARVCELSMGEKQRVEILKLLQRQSSILIFDEPTAVLTPQEADKLYIALKEMSRQGKALVFISHKLAEVMDAADDVSILRKGEVIDNMRVADVTSQAELARRMVGTETTLEVDRDEVVAGGRVLEVENLSRGKLKNVSLTLNRGEILGVVGVAGNGQKPLVETICGLSTPESGSIKIMGKDSKKFFSRFPNENSLSYIPEDRMGLAVCPTLDLSDNFLLTTRSGFGRGPWLKRKKVKKTSKKIVDLFSVFPGKTAIQAKNLSGGNLQKLVLGREFFRKPRLIVAEQPTQGLDITTTKDIWEHLISARKNAGVLLVTGDLNEALALSDRIAVMFDGQIVDTFSVSDKEKCDQLGVMMAGIAA